MINNNHHRVDTSTDVVAAARDNNLTKGSNHKSTTLFPGDDDTIEFLINGDFDVRLSILNRLLAITREDNNWFKKFTRKGDLFRVFNLLLKDNRWEVQHQCIKFIVETMHQYGPDLEWCMSTLLTDLVLKLGSSKITIRRATVQALTAFLRKQPEALHATQKALISTAIDAKNRDLNIVHAVLNELPNLFLPEYHTHNWSLLVDGLTRRLLIASNDDEEINSRILVVLDKLLAYVGQKSFTAMLNVLPDKQRSNYELLCRRQTVVDTDHPEVEDQGKKIPLTTQVSVGDKRNRFGIVPTFVCDMLNNESDPKVRINGLEHLKSIIEHISADESNKLVPHLHSFFVAIGNVLDDLNFKVVVLALDLLRLTVAKLRTQVEAHLQQIISIMGKHFGNQKAIIKQLIMITCIDLMHHLQPKSVIAVLCVFLQHKNSRIREEVINIISAALIQFPPNGFNLMAIVNILAPLLIDPKRRVRLAAFEQLSVLAQAFGNGKLEPMLKCIRDIEQRQRASGLMVAVQARLARHQLPRIRYDGLIEYSIPQWTNTDNSMSLLTTTSIQSTTMIDTTSAADFDWILNANIGIGGSAFSRSMSPQFPQSTSGTTPSYALALQRQTSMPPMMLNGNAMTLTKNGGGGQSMMKKSTITERRLPWEFDNDEMIENVVSNQPMHSQQPTITNEYDFGSIFAKV